MNVDLGIWNKLTRVVIVLCLIAGLIGIALWYLPLIRQNERMRREVERLDKQIQQEEEANHQLKAAIEAQKTNPKVVERLAREKLGYAKPDETIVRFSETQTNSAIPAAK